MGQSVASAFDIDRLFQDTIDLAVTVLDAEGAILMLFDPQTQELVPQCCLGGPTFVEGERVALGKGVLGWVAEHGVPVLLNNAAQDIRFDPVIDGCQEFPTQSVLCVPLLIKGQVIGTLEVLNKMPRPGFTDEDLSVLITLAAQAAIATENADYTTTCGQSATGSLRPRRTCASWPATCMTVLFSCWRRSR